MTRAILIVPAAGDPHGLLAAGACGSRPPVAWRAPAVLGRPRGYGKAPRKDLPERWVLCAQTSVAGEKLRELTTGALVLAWDGKPVPEGCDRAVRAHAAKSGRAAPRWPLTYDYLPEHVLMLANDCMADLGGEVVVLEDK